MLMVRPRRSMVCATRSSRSVEACNLYGFIARTRLSTSALYARNISFV